MPTRAQRPRLSETSPGQKRAAKAWNGGMTGTSKRPAVIAVVEECTVPGCGADTTVPLPAASMVRVHVDGTSEPARWYCPGRCAAIGRALAELRGICSPGGEE